MGMNSEDSRPCLRHKEYKKGCKDCFESNKAEEDNGDWINDLDMEDR